MPEERAVLGSIRFGRFELSVESGELRKDGQRLKLSGQAIQVLAMLVANPGKLVTREELQQRLWPGASFGDPEHGLNAAVNKLREALGDSATEPKYIETVPGRGYRLIATLEQPTTTPEPQPAPSSPESKLPRALWWKRKATIAVAACAVASGLLYPLVGPPIKRLVRLYELQQLTVLPLTALQGFVISPTFSPDGSQIAFAWGDGSRFSDLYVKVIGNDKLLRLTHQGIVFGPAWSPDGRNIAFRRTNSGDSGVFLISPLGGPERKVAPANCFCFWGGRLNWSPDGKRLAFLDHPADSPSDNTVRLMVLSLDSMESLPVKTDCNLVLDPAFSPRDDYLAWACADNESRVSVWVRRLADGNVTRLLHDVDGLGGLAWSGDGGRIVYSTGFSGGDLWEVASNRPNHPEKLPFGHDASDLAISFTSHRLAFTQNRVNVNIWRVDLSDPLALPQKVVASSRRQEAPDYSPDGTQIAFESDRSGSYEVWVCDSDGSNAVQLSSFGTRQTGSPHWSPDGKLIAFDSRIEGEANIYVVAPLGGVPRKLDIDVRGNSIPTWSHDGQWIYFVNGSDAHNPTIWKVPSKGGHALQIISHRSMYPLESRDGQYVYFSRDWQLWRVKTDGTDEQQIQGMPRLGGMGEVWRPFGSGIYFLGSANNNDEIDFFDLNTKKVSRIYVLEKGTAVGWMGGLPVSPDGRWLLFAQTDEISSDLMLVENWR